MGEKRYYFAYGSNTNLRQMEHRCPKATKVGRVILHNYRLTFNGKSSGWGVANIRRRNGTDVQGLLWEITPDCERNLDRYEGYPFLYEKKNVTVETESGEKIKAMVYVMTKSHQTPATPSPGYLDGIIQGFRQNEMDEKRLKKALWELEAEMDRLGIAI